MSLKASRKTIGVLLMMMSVFTAILFGNMLTGNAQSSQPLDIREHWAKNQIESWIEKGLVQGYEDGTFKPDSSITRAEFMTIVNRAFGYSESESISFYDVSSADWFYKEIAKAKAVGYISGYNDGTMKPNDQITRQEAAAIIARILEIKKAGNSSILNQFKDESEIAGWGKDYLGVVVENGYIGGYPDKTCRPENSITRAESIVMLDRVVGMLYSKEGTYGPESGKETVDGNVTVSGDGIVLRNIEIKGNLYLTEGIGEGNVSLVNVAVAGKTVIKGGGEHSVILENTTLGEVVVCKINGLIRIVAKGSTDIDKVSLKSGAKLYEESLTGNGFNNVEVVVLKPGDKVELDGSFEKVDVQASVNLLITGYTKVKDLTISENAAGTSLDMGQNTSIENLVINAAVQATGTGEIQKASINADNVKLQQTPKSVEIAEGKTAEIAGKTIDSSGKTDNGEEQIPSGSSGGSSGGSHRKSNDATLSDLMVNGSTVEGFDRSVLTYNIVLPYGTTEVPEVTAVTTHNKASIQITPAVTLPGTTTIVVTAENGVTKEYSVNFTIAPQTTVAVTGVRLDKAMATVYVDEEITLKATVEPENATNKNIQWSSSNETVATVVNGIVTAKAEGTAVITVTTVDGQKTASCTITVIGKEQGVTIRNVTTSINQATGKVKIEGYISSGAGKQVTIRVYDPNKDLDYIGQTTSTANGKFTFEFTPYTKIEGIYTVNLGGEDIISPVKESFHYSNVQNQ